MSKTISERITYAFHAIAVIAFITFMSSQFDKTDKVGAIFISIVFALLYLVVLSRTFYLSNILDKHELSNQFRWLSLIPFIGVVPNTIMNSFLLYEEYTNKSLVVLVGGTFFIGTTIWNFFNIRTSSTTQ